MARVNFYIKIAKNKCNKNIFKANIYMRKIVLGIIMALFCVLGLQAQNTSTLDEEKMTQFTRDLSVLPFSERDVIIKACELFKTSFKGDPDGADWAFQILYYYHQMSCEDKTATLHKTFSDQEIRGYFHKDIWVLPKLKNNIKDFIKEYAQWGYRISSDEDTSYSMEVDSTFLIKRLSKYLSKDFAYYFNNYVRDLAYQNIWHAEQDISIDEIFRRVAWRDELLYNNPNFIRADLVTLQIDELLFMATKGLEKTSIYGTNPIKLKVSDPREGFDFANVANVSDVIVPEYKNAIQAYYSNHTDTQWGKYLTEFMHRLSINKYRFSNEIDQFVMETLYPKDRKNIDPLLKWEDMLIDKLMN